MGRCVCRLTAVALLLSHAAVASAAKLVGPFTKDEYPQALIDRPLTLPAGMVEGELGFSFVSRRFDQHVLGTGGSDEWLTDVTLRVGITDRIQLEVGTEFSLDHELRDVEPFGGVDLRPSFTSWQRRVPVRLSLLALDTETLDTAVALTVPFVSNAERRISFFVGRGFRDSFVVRNGDGRVVPFVTLGAPTRWRLSDWFWLRAGEDLFSVTTGDGTGLFQFNLGIGVQPHPMFGVTLDTRIASIAFDGSGEEFSRTIADDGAVDLEGVFSPCRYFDVVGALTAPDVGDGLENYQTRMAVRVRF